MSKVLKRLYLGDVVKSFGTKQLRKLTTEEPVMGGLFDADDNLVASWDTLVNTYGMDCTINYNVKVTDSNYYKTNTASGYCVLSNNSNLANGVKLVIGEVETIGRYAFTRCNLLKSVIIANSVNSIGAAAFYDCDSLTSVTIPNSVTFIDDGAFNHCKALYTIIFEGTIAQWNAITFGANTAWNLSVPATYVQCTDGTVTL